jgi:DMSO/TMAO reductase YedYZ molybdopterin-dependent catalytic subunit
MNRAWITGAVALYIGVALSYLPRTSESQAAPAGTTGDATVQVKGELPKPLELTAADLAKMPRRSVRAKDRSGKESEYEGVLLAEILKAAGVQFGHELRGPAMANYLLVEAADGYRVVFALPELDAASTDRVIVLADRRDGKPLDTNEGPFRIIVPDEKRQARWVRQVTVLMVKRA